METIDWFEKLDSECKDARKLFGPMPIARLPQTPKHIFMLRGWPPCYVAQWICTLVRPAQSIDFTLWWCHRWLTFSWLKESLANIKPPWIQKRFNRKSQNWLQLESKASQQKFYRHLFCFSFFCKELNAELLGSPGLILTICCIL